MGGTGRRRVAVLMNHSQDPSTWPDRHRAGQTLDESPYGYGRAAAWFDVSWAVSHPESARARRLRIALAGRLGFDLVHAWRNRRLLLGADAVWTHTEVEHLAVALLQRLHPHRRRVPVLAQTIWLWDRWPRAGRLKRRLHGWLLRTHAVECVHSPLNLTVSRQTVPGRQVVLVPFGSTGLQAPAEAAGQDGPPCDVVAPGHDEHRDWATLAELARRRPELRFWVAAHPARTRGVTWPDNVRVERVDDPAAYAALLARASVCVLALKPNLHASGMTTVLEATSVGTPVVVAGDGGLPAIVGPGPRVVPSGDVEALCGAVDGMLVDPGSAGLPDVGGRGLTQLDYVTRYALLTDVLCGDRPWDESISKLYPQRRGPAEEPSAAP